jgi:glucosamine--fructose-6-phosphate aminotransferase (isomerizing)
MENALTLEDQCIDVAYRIAEAGSVSYAGRGTSYPLARFAALELGAVSSMYAEGLAGGELKHRLPRQRAQRRPLIMIAPFDETFDDTLRDVRDRAARGEAPILVGDSRTADAAEREGLPCIAVAGADPVWSPIVLAVPLQLVAHHAVHARSANLPAQRKLPNSRRAVE